MIIERDIMIAAGDGVGLATDIYRPHALRQDRAEPIGDHRERPYAALT
jgi:predicted acyl esterase